MIMEKHASNAMINICPNLSQKLNYLKREVIEVLVELAVKLHEICHYSVIVTVLYKLLPTTTSNSNFSQLSTNNSLETSAINLFCAHS